MPSRRRPQAIIASLGDAEVHVVLAVRDARSAIPTQWQTSARAGSAVPWRNFVLAVENALDPEASRRDPGAAAVPAHPGRRRGCSRSGALWSAPATCT